MKTYHKLFLILALMLAGANASAQSNDDPKALLKRGIALNDSGKYDEAIAKYNQAIKVDPNYQDAYYETAYTFFSTGKEKEAIPYLEKLISLNSSSAQAYDMLGSIYDDMKQPDKAMEYYKLGIKADPNYQRLHFNLAIAYYRQGKYPESEQSAIEAIKIDPKHASSQRVYAMTTYKQGKRGLSLLAWCSFLMIEPQTKRSPEAFAYIKSILSYGITKKDEKNVNITVSSTGSPSNMMMPISIIAATENKKGLSAIDSIQLQLTSLFQIARMITDDKKQQTFAVNYYADYFQKLATSGNMPAFTRYISLSINKDENLQWFKAHDKELSGLDKWINATERKF
jgi:tetratricopeptide (TPR) repeat protein